MDPAERAASIRVSVAYCPAPREIDLCELALHEGATVREALQASGLLERHPHIDLSINKIGVWGKLRSLDDALREGDRVEVYRPLKVDPKEARRQRYRSHREKQKSRDQAAR